MHYHKKSLVKLSMRMAPIAEAIGEKFYRRYHKFITISDGTRTAKEQASAMYENLRKTDIATQRKVYNAIPDIFEEIVGVYASNKDDRGKCVEGMTTIVDKYAKKGFFQHVQENAMDIQTRNFNDDEVDYLIKLVKEFPSLFVQDKRRHKNPHLHIQYPIGQTF